MSVAWVAVGATVLNGYSQNKSAKKAVNAQVESGKDANATTLTAQRESQAFQQKQFDQVRSDQQPWREAGAQALNKLAMAPDFSFDPSKIASEPGYQFGLNEGMRGLTNSAAARGGLLSGAALKASTRYAQDYAGTKANDAFGRQMQADQTNKNRLASLAGVGQTSVGQTSQAGMQFGQNVGQGMMSAGQQVGNNLMGAGNARASGYLAQGNALTGAVNQGLSMWNQYQKPGDYNAWASSNSGLGLSTNDLGSAF